MTIVVASVSPEGIALAADSRTTQRSGEHHRVASDHAQKVFAVEDRFGIATYGVAMIGAKTIRGLFDEWAAQLSPEESADPKALADSLGDFFRKELDSVTSAPRGGARELLPRTWPLGFLIAGYDAGKVGRIYELRVRPDTHSLKDTDVSTHAPTVLYRGQTSVLRRLILGIDHDEFQQLGPAYDEELRERAKGLRYDLITPVTTQDAVDFAFFLVDTTVQMQRFSDGTLRQRKLVPGCGGPTQGLAIEPGGLRWIRRNGVHVGPS